MKYMKCTRVCDGDHPYWESCNKPPPPAPDLATLVIPPGRLMVGGVEISPEIGVRAPVIGGPCAGKVLHLPAAGGQGHFDPPGECVEAANA